MNITAFGVDSLTPTIIAQSLGNSNWTAQTRPVLKHNNAQEKRYA